MMLIPNHIITSCCKGEQRGQYELFKLCFPFMMRICDKYHENEQDAKHDLNEAFLKILNNIERFDQEKNFYAWMKKILIRTIIDNFRKKKRRIQSVNLDAEEEASITDDVLVFNEAELKCNADELLHIIKSLPEMSKQVFNLYGIDGYSHAEVSEMLNISIANSKWHLFSARKKIKKEIEALTKYKNTGTYV